MNNVNSVSLKTSRSSLVSTAVAFTAGVFVLSVGLLLTTPSVRATLGLVTERFGLVLMGEQPRPTTTSVGNSGFRPPSLGLDEAQRLAPFQISLPAWLPDRVVLDHIFCQPNMQKPENSKGSADKCGVLYRIVENRQSSDPVVILDMSATSYGGGVMVNAAKAVEIKVNGLPALYVKGGYEENMEWRDDAPTSYLAWTRPDAKYVLLGTNVSREDLLRVAESIK